MGTLTDAEKVDARRHLGYPAIGAGPGSFEGWRFFQQYSLMEYRLSNMSAAEEAVFRSYLTNCNALETAIVGAGTNMDTAAAAVWTRNPHEMMEREALYRSWRLKLANFIGVMGPALQGSSMNVGLVV